MVKRLACGIRIFVLVVLLLLAYLVIWLQGGPRNIDWARGWLLESLNPADAPYDINFGTVSLRWQDITEFGDVRVTNLQMARKDGGIFATIPEVNVTLDPLGFLPTRGAIHGLEIDQPHLYLLRDAEGVLRLGLEGTPETLPVSELTGHFASDEKEAENSRRRMPFRALSIRDASLLFTDEKTGGVLKSPAFSFEISRTGRTLEGGLSMPFTWRDEAGSIDAGVMTQSVSGQRVLNARLESVPPELVCIFAQCPADIQFDGLISGKIALNKMPREPLNGGEFALTTKDAVLTAPEMFAEPLRLKKASIVASADDEFSTVTVESVKLDLPDTKIALTAAAQKRDDGWYAQGDAQCSRLNIGRLYKYWPLPLAPDSREWVTNQLKTGHAESGTLKFDFTPADFSNENIRDEAINATVLARGMEVDYLDGFPNVTEADGTATFTGKTITVAIDSGKLLTGTVVKPGSELAFTNLDIPATPMTTTLKLSAPARDVATILKLPPFTFDDALNINPQTIKGSADATIKLAFDAFSKDAEGGTGEVDFSGIDYDVNATLTDIGQPGLIEGRDISGFTGTVVANAKGAELAGSVKLDGTNLAIVLKDGPSESDTILSAKGTLATAQFANFGVPPIEQIGAGTVGIDASVLLKANEQVLQRAELDLTKVPVNVKEISWKKPAGTAAKLSIAPASAARSYSVKLNAPGISIGNATLGFNPAMEVQSLKLPRVKTDVNDFSLDYATKPGGYTVRITGEAFDLSDSYDDDATETVKPAEKDKEKLAEQPLENSILADFPALDLTIDLRRLVLVKKYPFTDVKGTLRCDARCTSADIVANTGDGNMRVTIGPVNGARQLSITNSNAGAFLRSVDISDRVYGGEFNLVGTYDDTQTPAPFTGRAMIHKFKLKNSEILARIISIGSLSGLANVLTGQGIDFDKFGMTIGALKGVVNVTKGRAESNALGLTVEGVVDTNASHLDLKGVVVPVSSLNSLLGKIPLIGAIAGSDEGLIAFTYSVKGPMADPNVFVNPLSGFTPGFLRGIFTAGDEAVPTVPKDPESKPTVPADEKPQQPVPWPSEKLRR